MTADYLLTTPQLDDPYPYYRELRDRDPVHYSATEDLLRESAPLPTSFPAVDHDAAVRALGGDAVLVYTDSPFAPFWRDAATGRTTPAT